MECVMRHAHTLAGNIFANTHAMRIDDLRTVVVVKNGEEINLVPGRALDLGRGWADGAEMHAGLQPFLEEHRLNRIGGACHDICALARLRSGSERPDILTKRGAHLLRKPV